MNVYASNKLPGWISIGLFVAGTSMLFAPDLPILRYFFGSFGAWALGAAIGTVALATESADRKLAGWGVTLNVLCFPACLLYTMLFVFSPH